MTPQEFLDKYFAPEYCNVQNPAAWKAQAQADLQQVLGPQAAQSLAQKVASAVGLGG